MFGKIYETTWWGFPTKAGWGNIYYDLASSILSAFTSRIEADGGTLDNEIGLDAIDDTASLTMLPNAYKEGTLYSILPEDGTGDFDVVRGSSATRVNAEGLIEDIRYTTGNLVDYNALTSTSLSFSQNGDGKWVYDDSANGFLTTPPVTANVGDVFNVLVDVSVPSGGDANLRFTRGNASTILFNYTDFPDGVTEFQATITGVDGFLDRIFYPVSLNDGGSTLNRFEVTKIETATNIPRIDYTSGSPVLLLEPQATNLVNISEDFSVSSWSTNSGEVSKTLDVSQATPSGINGSYIIEGLGGFGRVSKNIVVTPSTDYTLSFYAKNIDATILKAVITNSTGAAFTDYTSQVNSTSWSRVEINFTTGALTTSSIFLTREIPVGESVYLWGVQLEEGSVATSYIPTNGAIATRLADSVSGAGDATTFNSTEGVLYAEMARDSNAGTVGGIQINDGSTDNSLRLFFNQEDTISVITKVGGSNNVVKTAQPITSSTAMNKFALVWKLDDYKLYYNGTILWSDTSAPVYPEGTLINLDLKNSLPFNGTMKDLRVYNTALTDAELITLTTI